MYIPSHFRVDNKDTMFELIENYSFGILISNQNHIPVATHLPFVLDRKKEQLTGHFAKPNEQWRELEQQQVLIIFQGPHHYISPSWYETNRSVPTWNYVAVHVYGTVEIVSDREELLASLHYLIHKYENPDDQYRIEKSNEEFVRGLMNGIVGFKITIDRLEGKWKLSQNHSKERRQQVIQALEGIRSENATQIAELMKKQREL